MSETDSFIEEVAEEVRRDRLFKLFRKYGWIAGLAIALIVGGAAWNEYRKATREAAARNLGDAMLTAFAIENNEARVAALSEIEAEGDASTVLEIARAAALAQAGDVLEADAVLAAVAAAPNTSPIYRDLARIKRLYLAGSGISDADKSATIDALAVPGGPFRTLAEEQRGLMLVEAGDIEGALSIFTALLNDNESTSQLITRSRQMIIVLGGSLGSG